MTRAELSILLTDDNEIRTLNLDYRGADRATDVLSFPLYEPDELPSDRAQVEEIGDVVISVPTANRYVLNGEHQHRLGLPGVWDLDRELLFLTVHSVLHLLGHDHRGEDEIRAMNAEEQRLFAGLVSTPGR